MINVDFSNDDTMMLHKEGEAWSGVLNLPNRVECQFREKIFAASKFLVPAQIMRNHSEPKANAKSTTHRRAGLVSIFQHEKKSLDQHRKL